MGVSSRMPATELRQEWKLTRKLALASFVTHDLLQTMVALAQWIEEKEPDVVAENRVWSFLGGSRGCVRQTPVQVADRDGEMTLIDYDWRRGPSLDQRERKLSEYVQNWDEIDDTLLLIDVPGMDGYDINVTVYETILRFTQGISITLPNGKRISGNYLSDKNAFTDLVYSVSQSTIDGRTTVIVDLMILVYVGNHQVGSAFDGSVRHELLHVDDALRDVLNMSSIGNSLLFSLQGASDPQSGMDSFYSSWNALTRRDRDGDYFDDDKTTKIEIK